MSELLEFVDLNSNNNVCILKSQVVGFAPFKNGYKVFLKQGGYILIQKGQYEYEKLKETMEQKE